MPTGQLLVWQARMPRQPIAWIAELAIATASAPSASALAKSAGVRRPPVMTSVTLLAAPGRGAPRAGQRGDGRHRDVVAEDQRRGAGAAAAAIEDDVVAADFERGVDVLLDVLGGELVADRDAAGAARAPRRRSARNRRLGPVREASPARSRRAFRQSARTAAILPTTLLPGRWPPVPVLAAWPPLKWKACTLQHLVPGEAEAGRGELVEVAAVRGLLLGQHAAFARADAGAGELGAARERDLGGLLGQRAEAHVGDEERDFSVSGFCAFGPITTSVPTGTSSSAGGGRKLRGHELDVVPGRQVLPRHAHGRDRAVVAGLAEPVGR